MEKTPCGHTNLILIEHGRSHTTHVQVGGREPWFHDSGFDDYTGEIDIECGECDRKWHYGPKAKRPKWVQRVYKAAIVQRCGWTGKPIEECDCGQCR